MSRESGGRRANSRLQHPRLKTRQYLVVARGSVNSVIVVAISSISSISFIAPSKRLAREAAVAERIALRM